MDPRAPLQSALAVIAAERSTYGYHILQRLEATGGRHNGEVSHA
jgi:DNA-binding PadR family transcriptional regulator